MAYRKPTALLPALMLTLVLATGCNNRLAENIRRLNEAATRTASGDLGFVSGTPSTPLPPTPQPTPTPPNLQDLTTDPNATLAHAWGVTYTLPAGSEFTIIATEQQVGDYIVRMLQLKGWDQVVRGGSAKIALGQIRLDLAMEDSEGKFGAGTITFQPTLDAGGVIHLNPRGADFGGLQIPDNFTPALGDAVHSALSGAESAALSRVRLSLIALDNGTMRVSGTMR